MMIQNLLAQIGEPVVAVAVTSSFLGVPETLWNTLIAAIVAIVVALGQQRIHGTVKKTEKLVNSQFGVQLNVAATALERLAAQPNAPKEDKEAAVFARKAFNDHQATQREIDKG